MNEKIKMQRQKFTMNEGDHLTLLNVYKTFISNKKSKVNRSFYITKNEFYLIHRNGVKRIKSIDEIYYVHVQYVNNYGVYVLN